MLIFSPLDSNKNGGRAEGEDGHFLMLLTTTGSLDRKARFNVSLMIKGNTQQGDLVGFLSRE